MKLLALLLLLAAVSMLFLSPKGISNAWRWLAVTVALASLTACILSPPNDYPTQYPPAESSGPCPDLSGWFDNAGVEVPVLRKPKPSPLLTSAIFPPGDIPLAAPVARVRLHGPEDNKLSLIAVSADNRVVSEASLAQVSRIQYGPTLTEFLCKGNHIEVPSGGTDYVHQLGVEFETYNLEFFRAKDGSLILLEEKRHAGILIAAPYRRYSHKWYRFAPAADVQTPVPSLTQ